VSDAILPQSPSLRRRLAQVGLAIVFVGAAACRAAPPLWQTLHPGMARQETRMDDVVIVAFRADLAAWRASVVSSPRPRRVADGAPRSDHIGVNASFFDPDLRAMGLVIDDAGVHGKQLKGWAALALFQGTSRVIAPGVELGAIPAIGLVQGLPRLVQEGRVVDGLKEQHAVRTAVCADDGFVTIVVTRGAVESVAFAEHLRRVVGCTNAINLDGGPSTQLSAKVGSHLEAVTGGWGVPNLLILTPR
jgi:hypothetical protein